MAKLCSFKAHDADGHISAQHRPPSLHMTVSPFHENIREDFLKDLREAGAEVSQSKEEDALRMAAI